MSCSFFFSRSLYHRDLHSFPTRRSSDLYVGRDLQFVTDIPAGHVFRGEQQDLEEMLGNLMDNACKWARRRVVARSRRDDGDRKSTRLNSSHTVISYAVFCLKKKNKT